MAFQNARETSALVQLRLLVRLWWLRQRRRARRATDAPQLARFPVFLLILLVAALSLTQTVWGYTSRDVERAPESFGLHLLGALAVGLGWGMFKAAAVAGNKSRGDDMLAVLPLKLGPRFALQVVDTLWVLPAVLAIPAGAISALGDFELASLGPLCLSIAAFLTMFVLGYAGMSWVRVWGPPTLTRWAYYAATALMFTGSAFVLLPIGVWLAEHPQPFAAQVTALVLGRPSQLLTASAGVATASFVALWLAERCGFDRLDMPPSKVRPSVGARARSIVWRQGGRELSILLGLGLLALAVWLCVHPERARSPEVLLLVSRFLFVFGATQLMVLASRSAAADQRARPLLCALPIGPAQWLTRRSSSLSDQQRPTMWLLSLLAALSLMHSFASTYRLIVSALALAVAVPGMIGAAYLAGGGPAPVSVRSVFAPQLILMPLFATVFEPSAVGATIALAACAAVSWEARRSASVMLRFWDDPADDIVRETAVWPALLALGAFFALQSFCAQSASTLELAPGYAFALTFLPAAALLALLIPRTSLQLSLWPRAHGVAYVLLGSAAGIGSGFLALELARQLPLSAPLPEAVYSGGEWIAIMVTTLLVAPTVEEAFFRGWLQRALALQLPAAQRSWAFVLAAGAFALAHFGGYGVPQFVLGLLVGALFRSSGALLPSILGHCAHNLVVVLAGA